MTRIMAAAGLALALSLTVGVPPLAARGQTGTQPGTGGQPFTSTMDAQATRQQLQTLLREHPPSLRGVLQLDPTLLTSDAYLAPYPRLAEFLRQHPEVARNPFYFLGTPVNAYYDRRPIDDVKETLAGLAVFVVAVAVLALFTSLVRQLFEYRRWLRQSRIQADVHTKVLDRLQSNEDLLAYVQTPAGRQFLEASAPAAVIGEARPAGVPVNRILWSVQAGVVLTALGIGLWRVQQNVIADVAPAFYVLGVIAIALGLGAVASAGIAYALSARLGLLPQRSEPS